MLLRGLIVAALFTVTSVANATELTVYSSIALRGAMETIAPKFEKATGFTLRFKFGAAPALGHMIKAGEKADVVILTPHITSELLGGQLVRDVKPFVRTQLGLAVRQGTEKPSIETEELLIETLVKAEKIAFAKDGASGLQFQRALKETGLDTRLLNKLIPVTGFKEIEMVAEGHATIGIQMVSEILPVKGVVLAGTLPGRFAFALNLQSAVARDAPQAASIFTDYLRTNESAETLRANGMTLN